MKKLVCLVLCFSMVFGLFANDLDVNIELPSFNFNSGLSSQFFFNDEKTTEQQPVFGNQVRQFNRQKNIDRSSRFSINGLYQNSQGQIVPLQYSYTDAQLGLIIGVVIVGALAIIGVGIWALSY
jgi:hypothetical protein